MVSRVLSITALLSAITLAGCGDDKGAQTENCGLSCSSNSDCKSYDLYCDRGTCKPTECSNCTASQTCKWSTSKEGDETYCKFDECQ